MDDPKGVHKDNKKRKNDTLNFFVNNIKISYVVKDVFVNIVPTK